MYSRKILRRMLPIEREEAKLINELESCVKRLKNRLPKIHQAELESRALLIAHEHEARCQAITAMHDEESPF